MQMNTRKEEMLNFIHITQHVVIAIHNKYNAIFYTELPLERQIYNMTVTSVTINSHFNMSVLKDFITLWRGIREQ